MFKKAILPILILTGSLTAADSFSSFMKPVFEKRCNECHGEKKVKGKVNLYELKSLADLQRKPKIIKEMIEVLDAKDMPPEDEPQLDEKTRLRMITELKELLKSGHDSVAHAEVRRLNRVQYNYAVRDLLKLNRDVFSMPENMILRDSEYNGLSSGKMPAKVNVTSRAFFEITPMNGVEEFPKDLRAEHGYNNQADNLSMSPLLMESFLALSTSIVGSVDFNDQSCGIWADFFAAPKNKSNMQKEIARRLRDFLTIAFRSHVDEYTIKRYTAKVLSEIQKNSFTDAMKVAASAALASPRFLYIYNTADPKENPHDYNYEIASRLSFFLWGSLPDRNLLNIASQGKLTDRNTLSKTVDAMMKDQRSLRFCDSFASQWLQLERILSSAPNRKLVKNFYLGRDKSPISSHMVLEPLLLFETVYTENRPAVDLLNPNFTYRSKVLNNFYTGSPITFKKAKKTKGKKSAGLNLPMDNLEFIRIPIKDRRYGGIVNNAAVMTMTSAPERTQPITRGAWVTEVVFNDPPPPPPNNIPTLDESVNPREFKKLSVRERFAMHRKNEDCTGCHSRLDPLGFALESFDIGGHWREVYARSKAKVNATGILFKKHKFTNALEFKDALVKEKAKFARALTGHIMKYALTREMTAKETLVLDGIIKKTANTQFSIRSIIKEVTMSQPFLQGAAK